MLEWQEKCGVLGKKIYQDGQQLDNHVLKQNKTENPQSFKLYIYQITPEFVQAQIVSLSPGVCISNKFPGDVLLVLLGGETHFENHWTRVISWIA